MSDADVAFVGRVISSTAPSADLRKASGDIAIFHVEKALKGRLGATVRLDQRDFITCRSTFVVGKSYVVLGRVRQGRIETSICLHQLYAQEVYEAAAELR